MYAAVKTKQNREVFSLRDFKVVRSDK